jgi:GxxExxY protein
MRPEVLIEEELTKSVIRAFYDVYNTLGYGFLENLYIRALEEELKSRGHSVAREYALRVIYNGIDIGAQRIDMVVDGKVVIEVKSTEHLHPSAIRQVYSYLRGTGLEVGLLLHFGPQPKFYRQIWKTDRSHSTLKNPGKDTGSNSFDPVDPFS